MKTWRTIKLFLHTVKYGHPLTARTETETEIESRSHKKTEIALTN